MWHLQQSLYQTDFKGRPWLECIRVSWFKKSKQMMHWRDQSFAGSRLFFFHFLIIVIFLLILVSLLFCSTVYGYRSFRYHTLDCIKKCDDWPISYRNIETKRKAYDNGSSQSVPHPITIPARRCLTSVIRRERVCSSWYHRSQQMLI